VWEALTRQRVDNTTGPQHLQCWHETLAVNIATGYTYMTGEPQAVLLHAGVGLLQGALGIRGAMMAEVPIVVMSGESVTFGDDPEFDIEGQWYAGVSPGGADKLVSSYTKWAALVPSAATLYQSVIRAGEMAQRTPQGPVYLDVPIEYMLEDWTPSDNVKKVPPAPKTQAAGADIERMAGELARAKNPMIIVDLAGRDTAAYAALIDLAETLAVPVIGGPGTSFTNFPNDNPLWQGIGSYQHLKDCDLILLVDCRTPWYPPSKRPTEGRIVAVSSHPFKAWLAYQNLLADDYLEGNVAGTLAALTTAVAAACPDAKALATRRAKWAGEHEVNEASLKAERDKSCAADRLDAYSVAAAVADIMPADTIYADETITHFRMLRQHLPQTRPQTLFRHTGGGLGQGMGLALGLKLAAPERPVVLFIGDGSLLYNPIVQALGGAKEHGLPTLTVVMNNGGYRAMAKGHAHHYPDGIASQEGFTYGVDFDAPDYENLGSHFGFPGERTDSYQGFRAALERAKAALADGKSTIINAVMVT
jgi:acetolactate synthase-1/2/3 large subunit